MRALAAAVLALAIVPAAARGKAGLDILRELGPQGSRVAIATFTDEKDRRIGLLGIKAQSKNSITFHLAEWNTLIAIVDRAAAAQGDEWKEVGDYTETNTSDVSHLTVKAGPGIEFTITSPKGATVVGVVLPGEIADLKSAMERVRGYLAAAPPQPPK